MVRNLSYYNTLVRSPLTPPNYVFSIVWPILYFTLAIVFALIYSSPKCIGLCNPLVYFSIQMAFNVIWTTLFFKLKKPTLAFIDLSLIVLFTLATLRSLYKDYRLAFYIMLPYTAWIMFALYLNGYIVFKN